MDFESGLNAPQVVHHSSGLGEFIFPAIVAGIVILILITLFSLVKNNYIKVSPNQVAVISGRRRKLLNAKNEAIGTVGYRLVRGGAAFIWPFLEKVEYINLTTITIPNLEVKEVVTSKGVPVSVKAVANLKIGSEEALLDNAVERLLGKTQEDIKNLAYQTLEGHLRAILGTLTVEEAYSDRVAFGTKIINESQSDFTRLGLRLDILTIKEITDGQGYLDALGKTRIAEVKRDAEIGAAQANRESTIKSTTAKKDGDIETQRNLALSAEAVRDKDLKIQQFRGTVEAETAKASQAGPLTTAAERIKVVQKETELAEAEAIKQEKTLVTTVIKPAEAGKLQAVIVAEGQASAAIAKAEGESKAKERTAEADKVQVVKSGEASAEATRLKLVAEAEGNKARMLAEAEGNKAQMLAQAEGQKAQLLAEAQGKGAMLLAEAEGILKKAEAYKELEESGRLLQILESLQILIPGSIEKLGPVMKEIAAPMANIDKVVVIDGGNGDALATLSKSVPKTLFSLLEGFGAHGIDVSSLLSKVGVQKDGDTGKKAIK